MQPLCYHLCFHLRISFSSRHRNEFKLFCSPKWAFFSCFVSYALLLNKSSQPLCAGAFCSARVLLLLPCEQILLGRANLVSFYFSKCWYPQNCKYAKLLLRCVYILYIWYIYIYIFHYIQYSNLPECDWMSLWEIHGSSLFLSFSLSGITGKLTPWYDAYSSVQQAHT